MYLLENAAARILEALPVDRAGLRRQLKSLERAQRSGRPFDRSLARFQQLLAESIAHYTARRLGVPRPRFDNTLPVSARRDEIAQALAEHQVIVVCGETGSGKSTQLPQICLAAGRGVDGYIGHTQPRRIAARGVASRVAHELGTPLGEQVGYKVRFTDYTNPRTYIKLMTDGILLAESQQDHDLRQYDTLIIDEAHERSLNIDFLLGYLKRLLPRRPELKLIVTSATIDAERFARHFSAAEQSAPVIEVSGRTYPVETRYRPLAADDDLAQPNWLRGVLDAYDELRGAGRGDMLIFLPTESDIHAVAKALRGRTRSDADTEILPLYARLSAAEQNRVFEPHTSRRVVLATNVAESSLTVPNVRYVIDTGTARISRYSSRQKVQRLPIEPVSRASADQRQGRCGRVGPGICIRLYSEDDYLARDRFTPPEIQRSNLAAVILQAKSLRLGALDKFPFLDPPRPDAIRDGQQTLFELGAIDEQGELTELGQALARLPIDPRLGRMILAAADGNCLHEVLIIASALAVQDVRERPADRQEAADAAHRRFADDESDFLSYLKLWEHLHDMKLAMSHNQMRKACRDEFINHARVREWFEIHRQLLRIAAQAGLRDVRPAAGVLDPHGVVSHQAAGDTAAPLFRRAAASQRPERYQAIHRALLTGLLSNIARRGDQHQYVVAGGQKAYLWPGSGTFEKRPKWIVAAEVVETRRRYLRTVARINPGWIEPLADHLLERTYAEPHWDPTVGSAMVFENASLWGLAIVRRRRRQLAPVDALYARELLLDQGLTRGGYETRSPFLEHNRQLLAELQSLERKSRRSDLLKSPAAIYEFYDHRVPAEVTDGRTFETWRRTAEHDDRRLLFMRRDDLLQPSAVAPDAAQFPDTAVLAGVRMPLEYHFQPGAPDDGVTLIVPHERLAHIDPTQLDWLVPGQWEEKLLALVRSLPKTLRKQLGPAPDAVRAALPRLRPGEGSLTSQVAIELTHQAGTRITTDDFRLEAVPAHLWLRVRVVDEAGRTVAEGRHLPTLRRQLQADVAAELHAMGHAEWSQSGITRWDFGDLPEQTSVERRGLRLVGYPTLVDEGGSVRLELAASADAAREQLRLGVRRLAVLAERRALADQVAWLPHLGKLELLASSLPAPVRLREQWIDLLAERAFLAGGAVPRTAAEFDALLVHGRERIGVAVQETLDLVSRLLTAHHQAQLAWQQRRNPHWQYATDDVADQLRQLTAPGFLSSTPWEWLSQYPRYFQAIGYRLERLSAGGWQRDQQLFERELEPRWQAYREAVSQRRAAGEEVATLEPYRWLLEEFRVSLFAQKLGTCVAVSPQRLDQHWRRLTTSPAP